MWKDNNIYKVEDYNPLELKDEKLMVFNSSGKFCIYCEYKTSSYGWAYLHPNGNIYDKNFGFWDTEEEATEFLYGFSRKKLQGACNATKCVCDIVKLMIDGCPYQKSLRLERKLKQV